MNGARTIFRRKGYLLTALAAAVLLAASSGTAYAQTVNVDRVSLSSTAVNEGGEATAIVNFTVTAADGAEQPAGNAMVRFAFVAEATVGDSDVSATRATGASFSGLTGTLTQNEVVVPVPRVRAGASRKLEARRTFRLNHDLDAEDEKFDLDASATWADVTDDTYEPPGSTSNYIINDDEEQKYILSLPAASKGMITEDGGETNVLLTADPKRTAEPTVPMFTWLRDGRPYTSDPMTLEEGSTTIAAGLAAGTTEGAPATIVLGVLGAAEDKNRTDDTTTLIGYTGGAGTGQEATNELVVKVIDVHKLPAAAAITAVARDKDTGGAMVTEIVEGGDPVYLTITVDRRDEDEETTVEPLSIAIRSSAAQAGDYDVEHLPIVLQGGTREEESTDVDIMLRALEDEDVGAENLELHLVVSGMQGSPAGNSTGTFPITIVDKTTKQVEPKSLDEAYPVIMTAMEAGAGDESFNPGESFSVMTSDLFTVTEGYTAAYGASVEGSGVSVSASADSITVEAISATDGEAKVTVTATAKMAASSFIASQTVSNIAEITFPVTVVDKKLVVMLEMPANVMNGNIVEGMSYEIGVMATRMITEAEGSVEVMIMRDRANSDAGDDDFSVSMATIMAGYDSATAELMVTEDDMPDSGTNDNMGEQLVLYGMAGDMETNALTFTIWDQAVPALPLFGQLLLALFLMLGGARLYRRRQG